MKTLLCIFFSFVVFADCSLVENSTKVVSQLRNLPVKQPVNCIISSQEELKKYIEDTIREEYPAERLKFEGIIYEKLGFITSRNDYEKVITQLYTEEMAGVYDPKKKQFMMAGWIADHLQQPVVTHELVHALVDQQYDLAKYMDVNLTTDQQLARSAIAEGDATFTMLKEQITDVNQLLNFSLPEPSKPGTNMGLLFQMYFPYMGGLGFIQKCVREKCDINKFYTSPVTSTKEILFGKKYSEISEAEVKTLLKDNIISYKDVFGIVGFKSFLMANKIGISDSELQGLDADLLTITGEKISWILKFSSPLAPDLVKLISARYYVNQKDNYLVLSTY